VQLVGGDRGVFPAQPGQAAGQGPATANPTPVRHTDIPPRHGRACCRIQRGSVSACATTLSLRAGTEVLGGFWRGVGADAGHGVRRDRAVILTPRPRPSARIARGRRGRWRLLSAINQDIAHLRRRCGSQRRALSQALRPRLNRRCRCPGDDPASGEPAAGRNRIARGPSSPECPRKRCTRAVLRLGGAARGCRLPCLAQLDDVATLEAIRRARARGGTCLISLVKRTRGSGKRACGRRPWRRCEGRSFSDKSHAFTTDVVKISGQVLELLDFPPRGGGFVKEL
jgi:hypothetical protein